MINKFGILMSAFLLCQSSYASASDKNDDDFIMLSGENDRDDEYLSQNATRAYGDQHKERNDGNFIINDKKNDVPSEEMHEVDKLSTEALKKIVEREDNIENEISKINKELSELKNGIKNFANGIK